MHELILTLFKPFTSFVTPLSSRFHPLWHLTGLLLAALFVPRLLRAPWTSVRAFFAYCFPARVYRNCSSALDFRFFLVNQLGEQVLGWGVLFVGAGWCTLVFRRTLEWLHIPTAEGGQGLVVNLLFSFFTFVALDLAQYVSHWLSHKVSALWEFHKVHHAAGVLNPLTNYREHPVDAIMRSLCEAVPVGLVNAIFYHCVPQVSLVTLFGINIMWIPFNLTANLRHTHVWLTFPEKVSRWLISPAMHQVHHGSEPHHIDVNFGRVFTLWDRLGGTYYLPKREGEPIEFGLGSGEEHEFRTVTACYLRPFMNLGRGIVERLSSRRRPGRT
jgi:sterol desaturase/sphingolipid hydroxylase (fatty acid hydroxylase superfamily)